MTHGKLATVNNLKCTKSISGLFTEGRVYPVNPYCSNSGNLVITTDGGGTVYISPETLGVAGVYGYKFEVADDSTTTPEEGLWALRWQQEDEMIDQKQSKEPIDCPVAIAYHIHELQKWLKHIGCSSEAEFRISSDYVWASPDEFVTYEAKEGGVGTLIEYMRHIGGANKCVKKMEDVG